MKEIDIINDPSFSRKRRDPLTNVEFLANHRKRKHLNNKNKNEYHNWKRRAAKRKEELKWIITIPDQPLTENRFRAIMQEIPIDIKPIPAETQAIPPVPVLSSPAPLPVANTVEVLPVNKDWQMLAFLLGGRYECIENAFKMLQAGFNFNGFDSQETIPGRSELIKNFGPYTINYHSETEVHITYRKYISEEPNKLVINKNK